MVTKIEKQVIRLRNCTHTHTQKSKYNSNIFRENVEFQNTIFFYESICPNMDFYVIKKKKEEEEEHKHFKSNIGRMSISFHVF